MNKEELTKIIFSKEELHKYDFHEGSLMIYLTVKGVDALQEAIFEQVNLKHQIEIAKLKDN